MTEANANKSVESEPAENRELSLASVLDWSLQLSAEERGWIDQAYKPPLEVVDLANRLSRASRSFYVLTGLWGVGKSSALQFITDKLDDGTHHPSLLRLAPDSPILDQLIAADLSNPEEERREIKGIIEARHRLGRMADDAFRRHAMPYRWRAGEV
jgi:hypothetical protein